MSLQTTKSDRTVEALIRRVNTLEERNNQLDDRVKQLEDMLTIGKEPTEKELLQEQLDALGIKYTKRDSIVKLKELLGE